jgi:FkbM family methyltransferase
MRNRVFPLFIGYVQSLETVRCGKEKRDKLKILVNRMLYASYPLNHLSYRIFRRPLFEPTDLIGRYKCKYGNTVFTCPGGNSDLQFLKRFEPDVKQIISESRDGDAVDVGANFGLYTVMMSKSRSDRGSVLSIEPDVSYYRFLAENILSNNCRNVIPLNIAAWSSASKLAFKRHVFGGPSEDTIGEQAEGAVDARPLDQVFSDYDISPRLVKIDVEGAEHEILRGMERTLRATGPDIIFEALNRQALVTCSSLLEESGYSVRQLPDRNFLARLKY